MNKLKYIVFAPLAYYVIIGINLSHRYIMNNENISNDRFGMLGLGMFTSACLASIYPILSDK